MAKPYMLLQSLHLLLSDCKQRFARLGPYAALTPVVIMIDSGDPDRQSRPIL